VRGLVKARKIIEADLRKNKGQIYNVAPRILSEAPVETNRKIS
jgi:hypothetical protein